MEEDAITLLEEPEVPIFTKGEKVIDVSKLKTRKKAPGPENIMYGELFI